MNPNNRIDESNNRTRAIAAAIPMAGTLVAAAFLSGLSLTSSYYYQPAMAQQNMTGGGGNVTTGGNATTTGAAAGNQTELIMHLEEVRTALQNNDIQGAMLHLDLALNLLGVSPQANTTSTTGTTNSTA